MQYEIISISIVSGNADVEALNHFLRSHKVVNVDKYLVPHSEGSVLCFCITYLEGGLSQPNPSTERKAKVDYKEVLDDSAFARFASMRTLRNEMAERIGVPPYAIFTNAELAEAANFEHLDETALRSIQGIGQAKMERYGKEFVARFNELIVKELHENGEQPV